MILREDNKIISQLNFEIPDGMKTETTLIYMTQKPRYFRIGNGLRNTFMTKEHNPIDAIDQMANMTPQELWVIKLLKDNLILVEERTAKGIKLRTSAKAIIKASELTNAEQQKFKTGYKRLHIKNLLKRIKREHYILNPDFFIPHYYQEERELFDNLKKTNNA